jgi:hypothetical protein
MSRLGDRLDVRVVPPSSAARDPDASGTRDLLADVDLVYIQKDATPPAMELAGEAACRSIPIVYDLDDDIGCWPGMDEAGMARRARVVVVDSPTRAATLSAVARRVVAIPCAMDQPDDPARGRARHAGRVTTVGTFGNASSLVATVPWLARLPRGVTPVVVGPESVRDRFPGADYRVFDHDRFVADVMAMDVVALAHDPHEAPRKDENRLVMALSCGRPVIVAPSDSYVALLARVGTAGEVARYPEDVPVALAAYADPVVRDRVGSAGSAYVWRHYHPRVIDDALLAVFWTVLGAE